MVRKTQRAWIFWLLRVRRRRICRGGHDPHGEQCLEGCLEALYQAAGKARRRWRSGRRCELPSYLHPEWLPCEYASSSSNSSTDLCGLWKFIDHPVVLTTLDHHDLGDLAGRMRTANRYQHYRESVEAGMSVAARDLEGAFIGL